MRPVAVSGAGVIAPTGAGVAQFWDGLLAGRSGFRPASHFSTAGLPAPVIGYAPLAGDYDPRRRLGQLVRLAVTEALSDARVSDPSSVIMVLGTTNSGTGIVPPAPAAPGDAGGPEDPPLTAVLARDFARRLGLHPASLCLANASASGATAIGFAAELLECGDAEQVLAVGADVVTPQAWFGLHAIRALSPDGCQPFSRCRRGIRPAEAAGAMLLETAAAARRRGIRPRAWVRGYSASNLADNPARPGAESIAKAIREALAEAGVPAEAISYVNVHGPGTRVGDLAELDALRAVFGSRLERVPVNSSKPLLGHTQGAAGLVETLAAVLAVEHGRIPPTHGITEVDDPWTGLDVCADGPRAADLPCALSISCGLGGLNAAVVLGRPDAGSGRTEAA